MSERPLVIEQCHRVGQVGALCEQHPPPGLVQRDLRRIEWHDVERHPGSKHCLRRRDVHLDVVLGVGRMIRAAVAAANRPAHDHDALQLPERSWIALDRGADVRRRSDGDQRDLARMLPNLSQQKINCRRMPPIRLPRRPARLRDRSLPRMRLDADGYRNV